MGQERKQSWTSLAVCKIEDDDHEHGMLNVDLVGTDIIECRSDLTQLSVLIVHGYFCQGLLHL